MHVADGVMLTWPELATSALHYIPVTAAAEMFWTANTGTNVTLSHTKDGILYCQSRQLGLSHACHTLSQVAESDSESHHGVQHSISDEARCALRGCRLYDRSHHVKSPSQL